MNHDTTIPWWVQLIVGLALALMALAAMRVDLINNVDYGMTVSAEMATIMALAAIGVVAIPSAASILGWSRHLKAVTWICVALTIWAAINAYTAKQGAHILNAQASQENYTSAKEDASRAREVLKKISEVGDAEQLGKLADEADAKAIKDCRRKRSDECKLAEADKKLAHERLSNAKARDAAKADLAKAEDGKKAGPAESSMLATVIAGQTGGEPASIARYIALALTGLGILVTQLLALLGGHASSLIGGALKRRPPRAAKPKKTAPAHPTGGGTKQRYGGNVVELNATQRSVKGWLDSATVAGGDLPGGEALKAYKRYAGPSVKDMDRDTFRKLLTDILGEERIYTRTSGYTVRGLSLRAAIAKKAAAR